MENSCKWNQARAWKPGYLHCFPHLAVWLSRWLVALAGHACSVRKSLNNRSCKAYLMWHLLGAKNETAQRGWCGTCHDLPQFPPVIFFAVALLVEEGIAQLFPLVLQKVKGRSWRHWTSFAKIVVPFRESFVRAEHWLRSVSWTWKMPFWLFSTLTLFSNKKKVRCFLVKGRTEFYFMWTRVASSNLYFFTDCSVEAT